MQINHCKGKTQYPPVFIQNSSGTKSLKSQILLYIYTTKAPEKYISHWKKYNNKLHNIRIAYIRTEIELCM